MHIGVVGVGRMGGDIARRLIHAGHTCRVHDADAEVVKALTTEGAVGASSLADLVAGLPGPRVVWLMLPAGVTGTVLEEVAALLEPGDIVVDGGNSFYRDSARRAQVLAERALHFVDVGTSGGVAGLQRGYCLMIGGPDDVVATLDPIFRALAPGVDSAGRTPGRSGAADSAEHGYLHCGPPGAGHFVKMIHNGIEYGQMAALAEGLAILERADVGRLPRSADAETAPLDGSDFYTYDLDIAAITEVWRRGSVISSWLLDLTAAALHDDPKLSGYSGHVSDSGEGRWTIQAAVDVGVPAYTLSAALFERFSSRDEGTFGDKAISAMRKAFGGHLEKPRP